MEKILILSDFNVANLEGYLSSDELLPRIVCMDHPFGQVLHVLANENHACWLEKPDVLVIWSSPGTVSAGFRGVLEYEQPDPARINQEIEMFCRLVQRAAGWVRNIFLVSFTVPTYHRGLGLLDWKKDVGTSYLLAAMNSTLARALDAVANCHVINAQKWIESAGPKAYAPRLWYLSKTPFSNEVYRAASRDLRRALKTVRGGGRKLIVLDLDDTLWGGIVGDDGWENLRLGGHDAEGEAFRDFQCALKALTRRGLLLAIVSKNEESVALEAIDKHPEMVLQRTDFSGWRINWSDKAVNIATLVAELNLGLQSVVFIDDNPVERARVREALPEVLVPEWPMNKSLYRKTLSALDCFDTTGITSEDRGRVEMYRAEKERMEIRLSAGSLDDWLATLEIVVIIERVDSSNLARVVQLLNKTNQMNLRTRRMGEGELTGWLADPANAMFAVRVSDKFGDQGLTGILGLGRDGDVLTVHDFVLSCRVMGRGVENLLVAAAIRYGKGVGCASVLFEFQPTAKNMPCRTFLEGTPLTRSGAEGCFSWGTTSEYPFPAHLCFDASVLDGQ